MNENIISKIEIDDIVYDIVATSIATTEPTDPKDPKTADSPGSAGRPSAAPFPPDPPASGRPAGFGRW